MQNGDCVVAGGIALDSLGWDWFLISIVLFGASVTCECPRRMTERSSELGRLDHQDH